MDATPEYDAEHKRRNSKVKLIQGDLDLRRVTRVEIEATDDAGRRFEAVGEPLSRQTGKDTAGIL